MGDTELKIIHVDKQITAITKVIMAINEVKNKDIECKKRLVVLQQDLKDLNFEKQALKYLIDRRTL
jgi:hypothetical protein